MLTYSSSSIFFVLTVFCTYSSSSIFPDLKVNWKQTFNPSVLNYCIFTTTNLTNLLKVLDFLISEAQRNFHNKCFDSVKVQTRKFKKKSAEEFRMAKMKIWHTDQGSGIPERWRTSVSAVIIFTVFRRFHMQLQSYLMRAVKKAIWAKKNAFKAFLQDRSLSDLQSRYTEVKKAATLAVKKLKVLLSSFFHRISCFYQGVLYSLFSATLRRFRPQHSATDETIANLHSSHSFSISSDASGSCLNLDDILDANCFLPSLFSKASHLTM